jgi:hypothetical protein
MGSQTASQPHGRHPNGVCERESAPIHGDFSVFHTFAESVTSDPSEVSKMGVLWNG